MEGSWYKPTHWETGFTTFSSWPEDAYALLGWHPPWLKITHHLYVDDSQTIWWAQLPQPKLLNHLPNIFPAIYWGVWRQLNVACPKLNPPFPITSTPNLQHQDWELNDAEEWQQYQELRHPTKKPSYPLIPQIGQVCSFLKLAASAASLIPLPWVEPGPALRRSTEIPSSLALLSPVSIWQPESSL